MLYTPNILKTHLWIDRFNSLQRQNTDEGRTHSSPVLTTSSSIKKSSSNSTSGGGEVDRVGHLIENMLNHQVLTPEHDTKKIVNHTMPGHDPLSFGHTQQIVDPKLILGVRITKPLYR